MKDKFDTLSYEEWVKVDRKLFEEIKLQEREERLEKMPSKILRMALLSGAPQVADTMLAAGARLTRDELYGALFHRQRSGMTDMIGYAVQNEARILGVDPSTLKSDLPGQTLAIALEMGDIALAEGMIPLNATGIAFIDFSRFVHNAAAAGRFYSVAYAVENEERIRKPVPDDKARLNIRFLNDGSYTLYQVSVDYKNRGLYKARFNELMNREAPKTKIPDIAQAFRTQRPVRKNAKKNFVNKHRPQKR